MNEFPWAAVHEYFAKPLAETGLKSVKELPPMMAIVTIEDGHVSDVHMLPPKQVCEFFVDEAGKNALSFFLQIARSALPSNTCIVVITEAYMRMTTSLKEAREIEHGNLAEDLLSEEVVMISMHGKSETQMGMLKIDSDRSLQFVPFEKCKKAFGRLTPNHEKDAF